MRLSYDLWGVEKIGPRAIFKPQAGLYAYNPKDNELMWDEAHPSIISTLHEFAHYRFGGSELTACRFSVWLFKEAFPESYAKLTWDGHMLKLC